MCYDKAFGQYSEAVGDGSYIYLQIPYTLVSTAGTADTGECKDRDAVYWGGGSEQIWDTQIIRWLNTNAGVAGSSYLAFAAYTDPYWVSYVQIAVDGTVRTGTLESPILGYDPAGFMTGALQSFAGFNANVDAIAWSTMPAAWVDGFATNYFTGWRVLVTIDATPLATQSCADSNEGRCC
jgi:hypothetical protein